MFHNYNCADTQTFEHRRSYPLFMLIPVVQRFDISVNVKDGNVFISGFLTFPTVAIIRLDMNSLNLDIRLLSVLFHGLFCDFLLERVGWLESRDIVSRNNQGCILADIAGYLLCTGLDDKRAEATEIDVLAMRKAVFYDGHKLFYNRKHCGSISAGCPGDLVNYICFSHIVGIVL